jgi:hypothetical protein
MLSFVIARRYNEYSSIVDREKERMVTIMPRNGNSLSTLIPRLNPCDFTTPVTLSYEVYSGHTKPIVLRDMIIAAGDAQRAKARASHNRIAHSTVRRLKRHNIVREQMPRLPV